MLLAAPFAAPLAYLVVRTADEGETWSIVSDAALLGPLGRSLLLGTTVAAAAAAVGTLAAWLVMRTDLPGRRVARLLLPLPLVLPSFIGAFALIAAFARGGLVERLLSPVADGARLPEVGGFAGAFTVLTLLTYPYVYLPVAARLRQLPASMEESARLLGRGPLGTFATVVLPQARTAIAGGGLLVFLYTIADFGAVQLLRYDTLTRAIYANRLIDPAVAAALSLALGLLAIVVVVGQRRVAGRLGVDVRRGGRPLTVQLGRWRAAGLGFVGGLLTLSLVAPLAVLGYWAIRGAAEGSSRPTSLVADPGLLVEPAVNTSVASAVAAGVAVAAVLPVAFLTVRHRGRLGGAADALITGGFALPGIVIALALAFWTLNSPGAFGGLYQTLPLLVGAYAIHFGALALGPSRVAVASVPRRLDDAARTLGRGRLARLLSIDLPLMTPGLAAAAGLVLLSAMKELPVTLLLAPAGFPTLATRVWSAAEDAFWADASIAALLLVAVSGVLTWLLVVRRGEAFS
ncbi:ABC transporter permease [Miltoncostaea marina]|uniref:ABC transporter permease n=1 Tax=Miltoncostaea marina TaxID=2843215 RepID=UPI001C3D26FB|nr:iron ABC transporter permease [Miltoncostaea marina]